MVSDEVEGVIRMLCYRELKREAGIKTIEIKDGSKKWKGPVHVIKEDHPDNK